MYERFLIDLDLNKDRVIAGVPNPVRSYIFLIMMSDWGCYQP
jgi:hypothetical protein